MGLAVKDWPRSFWARGEAGRPREPGSWNGPAGIQPGGMAQKEKGIQMGVQEVSVEEDRRPLFMKNQG